VFQNVIPIAMSLLFLTLAAADNPATAAEAAPRKRPTVIWDRTEPLGEMPRHVTDAFPLSDQENKLGWTKLEPMSDEFEGKELDRNKWRLGMYWWKGRQPALFSDKNVNVSDGPDQILRGWRDGAIRRKHALASTSVPDLRQRNDA
jgi:hypothetical protein